jgi:hypothetical protein
MAGMKALILDKLIIILLAVSHGAAYDDREELNSERRRCQKFVSSPISSFQVVGKD